MQVWFWQDAAPWVGPLPRWALWAAAPGRPSGPADSPAPLSSLLRCSATKHHTTEGCVLAWNKWWELLKSEAGHIPAPFLFLSAPALSSGWRRTLWEGQVARGSFSTPQFPASNKKAKLLCLLKLASWLLFKFRQLVGRSCWVSCRLARCKRFLLKRPRWRRIKFRCKHRNRKSLCCVAYCCSLPQVIHRASLLLRQTRLFLSLGYLQLLSERLQAMPVEVWRLAWGGQS